MLEDTIDVHNSKSQRLDAKLIADLYDVSLSQLAQWSDLKYNTLKRTPDSKSAQRPLQQLVGAWELLATVLSNAGEIRKWLNHPIPDLDGNTPLWLLSQNDGVSKFAHLAHLHANKPEPSPAGANSLPPSF